MKVHPLFLLWASAMFLSALGVGAEPRMRVLVLQSYNEHLTWTNSIAEGIQEKLGQENWDVWFESLDAKNLAPDLDLSALDLWLQKKYRDDRFDLVIAEDDTAYSYFVRTRDTIFHHAPAVAIGLNGHPPVRLPGVSYILENPDFARTLNLALNLYPQSDTIHIVIDHTDTGRLVRNQIEKLVLTRRAKFDWIDSESADEVVSRCVALAPGEILAFAVYFNPSNGYNSFDRLLRKVNKVVRVPIFAFWEFAMDSGATGGFLYDGRALGRAAAEVAQGVVQGTRAPVFLEGTYSRWGFDWTQLDRFAVPRHLLPNSSVFFHSPKEFWSLHWMAVSGILLVFGLLVGVILLSLWNVSIKHKMIAAGEAIIATQRELMASLGDVIETRSEETASHVQRITRLSTYLGDLVGVSPEQREQLEVCASMHDIGKVGIADEILKNPGSLTEDERAIMRTHTLIGHSIFASSPNPMFQVAASIALEHHERWDGSGYPHGKSGTQISVLARIVSLVDVFDALLTKRVYKEAWEPDQVRAYLREESGAAFDPQMVQVFLEHWDEFYQLRENETPVKTPKRRKKRRGPGLEPSTPKT